MWHQGWRFHGAKGCAMTAVTPGREAKLLERLDAGARHQDYPEAFGESWPKLCADAASAIRRLAAKPADEGRTEAAYAAYLGIMVLATMCKKAGLSLAQKRATELLIEMGEAFPSFAGRSALRTSTPGARKP